MFLRQYQQNAINAIFDYFKQAKGNPLIVAPTGSGKSLIIAGFIEKACRLYPGTKITILAHRKELLQQNAEKLKILWPEIPLGIYSAGLKKRETNQITIAGIQSVYDKAELFNYQSLVLVDESHLIPKDGFGMYRTFLDGLKLTNPKVKTIGFTATPYRLDSGMLTDGDDRFFTDIAYDIEIRYLINNNYLSPLISKKSEVQADLSDVRIRGGEFMPGDSEKVMDTDFITQGAIKEMLKYGTDRKSWIVFCAGINHAKHVSESLNSIGILTKFVTGETPAKERAEILEQFKNGDIRALTNCDVLTTGFDAPNIDLLVLLRPTKSVGLYVQMVGRGARLCSGKKNCCVLDFAGNIERFGPIDAVKVKRSRKKTGEVEVKKEPQKTCPSCQAYVHARSLTCDFCGHDFPEPDPLPKHDVIATDSKILSEVEILDVINVNFKKHSKNDKISLRVDYICADQKVSQFVCLEHSGYARIKAREWWRQNSNEDYIPSTVDDAFSHLEFLRTVKKIHVTQEGKYKRVIGYEYYMQGEMDEAETLFDEFGVNI